MGELRMAGCMILEITTWQRTSNCLLRSFLCIFKIYFFIVISIYDLWAVWLRGRSRFEFYFRKFRILHTDEYVSETCSFKAQTPRFILA